MDTPVRRLMPMRDFTQAWPRSSRCEASTVAIGEVTLSPMGGVARHDYDRLLSSTLPRIRSKLIKSDKRRET